MSYRQLICKDFDEFAAAVREVDCTMMPQNPTVHSWSISIADAGSIEVQLGELGSGNILEGTTWKDGVLFYSPLSSNTRYRLNGEALEKNAFMIIEPSGKFDLSSNAAHDWCTVFVPKQKLLSANRYKRRSFSTAADKVLSQQFQSLVTSLLGASRITPKFNRSLAAKIAENELTNICQRILDNGRDDTGTTRGRSKLNRPQLIRSAIELVSEDYSNSMRIKEISDELKISERTLRSLFYDYYAVSPKGFFNLALMRGVRDELILSDPNEARVGKILANNGVFQFGRFAVQYRETFGEKPSETLEKSASSRVVSQVISRRNS